MSQSVVPACNRVRSEGSQLSRKRSTPAEYTQTVRDPGRKGDRRDGVAATSSAGKTGTRDFQIANQHHAPISILPARRAVLRDGTFKAAMVPEITASGSLSTMFCASR